MWNSVELFLANIIHIQIRAAVKIDKIYRKSGQKNCCVPERFRNGSKQDVSAIKEKMDLGPS